MFAQNTPEIDSLIQQLKTTAGTQKADLLLSISDACLRIAPEKSIAFANQALQLSTAVGYPKGIGDSYNELGIANYYLGQFTKALTNYKKSLDIREKLNFKKDIANSLNNIGLVYNALGSYNQSLQYGLKALRTREEIGDKGYYIQPAKQ